MKFLIQTIDGEIRHDFAFAMQDAIRYSEWAGSAYGVRYSNDCDLLEDEIPVGSVEFVLEGMRQLNLPLPKPRNIPLDLSHFAGRTFYIGDETWRPEASRGVFFVKSADCIKKFECRELVAEEQLPPGLYQYSKAIHLESEWRAFVWRGRLVGLQNYSGDFTDFPDVGTIYQMIETFEIAGREEFPPVHVPCAYTVDVGCNGLGTFLVEVHDFFSCGLYGFDDHVLLPLMLGGWWKEYVQRCRA